jgi:hypothetical protein
MYAEKLHPNLRRYWDGSWLRHPLVVMHSPVPKEANYFYNLKNYLGAARPHGDRNGLTLDCIRKGAAVTILVVCNPVKKPGPWVVAHLRVVTPTGDPV